jgi:hypothetical protein
LIRKVKELNSIQPAPVDIVIEYDCFESTIILTVKKAIMKKKIFASLIVIGLALGVSAQEKIKEKDVPATVQASFKGANPEAKNVDWKMKDGAYKAKFKVNGMNHIASYDANGKVTSTGMEIKEAELPAAVLSAVKLAYQDRSIDDVYKVDKNGSTQYMVKLKGSPETKLMYSPEGQVIKEKMD